MYSFKHRQLIRPPPHTLPPAGLSRDAGHITAADCLRSADAAGSQPQPCATAYQDQCLQQEQAQGDTAAVPPTGGGPARQLRGAASTGGAEACLKPGPASPLLQQLEELREANYARSKQEPLGRPLQRGVALPEGLGTVRAFGVAVNARELERNNQGKHTIYPPSPANGTEGREAEAHALYLKSHRNYGPGEQHKYGYDFKGADPAALRFGAPPCPEGAAQLKAALQPGVPDDVGAMSDRLQRFALKTRPALGMPRSPNAMERSLPADFTYGKPPAKGEWGVDRILRGQYSPAEQLPDRDLGRPAPKSPSRYSPGSGPRLRRRQAPGAGRDAAEGVDAAAAEAAAARDAVEWRMHNNTARLLGSPSPNPTPGHLLGPSAVYRSVTEDHFRQPRSRQEMWEVVSASGVMRDRDGFEQVYRAACADAGNFGCCSLESFIRAKMELAREAVLGAGPGGRLPPL